MTRASVPRYVTKDIMANWEDFDKQMEDSGVLVLCDFPAHIEKVVIRTGEGDCYIAACHREGETLVFDLGKPIT